MVTRKCRAKSVTTPTRKSAASTAPQGASGGRAAQLAPRRCHKLQHADSTSVARTSRNAPLHNGGVAGCITPTRGAASAITPACGAVGP